MADIAALLRPRDLAQRFPGKSVGYWAKLRCAGEGPAFIKVGRSVFYAPADLDAWIERSRRRSTSDPGPSETAPKGGRPQGRGRNVRAAMAA